MTTFPQHRSGAECTQLMRRGIERILASIQVPSQQLLSRGYVGREQVCAWQEVGFHYLDADGRAQTMHIERAKRGHVGRDVGTASESAGARVRAIGGVG